ncbi:hypothetical protein HID58_093405 [Brassica napus]|uniref:Uncharacterized protein n=1 Tax=Brassica napus TaxID=3708 RepID=A0ABQ7XB71_BRANA|nr:hypothetical protein HID58_093403 [Brassica napus]KAH0853211.1 hypothetical protein HID58_093405 [Brassica napus]
MCDYNVGQIGLQVHGGAPGMSIPYLTLLSLPSQHRERQRIGGNDGCSGLGGISNYSPKSLFPPEKVIALHPRFRFSDPCCFRISAGGEIGAAQLLRGGKEHVMMFN